MRVTARALERLVRERVALEDAGLRVRIVDSARAVVVESDAGLLTDVQAAVARAAAAGVDGRSQPVMTYLANTIRSGPREIPYSLIAALDLDAVAPGIVETTPETPVPSLVLNEWAASNLEVEPGAPVTIDYYVWEEPGRLVARSADFRLARGCADQRGRSRSGTDIRGHHRLTDARWVGSAVSHRSAARQARRRGVLGGVPDDAQGVRPAGGGPASVAVALRRAHVAARHAKPWANGRASACAVDGWPTRGSGSRSRPGSRCARFDRTP